MTRTADVDQVLAIIKEVSAEFVEPRFRSLGDDEIDSKAPGDYVTVADRQAEQALTKRFRGLDRNAVVVGEEGSYLDPTRLEAIGQAKHCFVVDPLDGTNNFVRGSQDFAVMVAELHGTRTVGAWIYQPELGKSYVATPGGGVECNGEAVECAPIADPPRGASTFRAWRDFDEQGNIAPVVRASGSAGIDYPHVVTGVLDFVVYRFPKPWDHLPGQLMLQELGGDITHLDGRLYRPGSGTMAILSCRDLDTGRRVASRWPHRQ